MSPGLLLIALLTAFGSTIFGTLSYAIRDVTRSRLLIALTARGKANLVDPIIDGCADLVFLTAGLRLTCNVAILVIFLHLLRFQNISLWVQYVIAIVATLAVTVFFSVALPSALARHAGAVIVAIFARPLLAAQSVLWPITRLGHSVDTAVGRAAGTTAEEESHQAEADIISAVEEGQKEGVVDATERRMIEAAIRLGDTAVSQVMTARPEMVSVDANASLEAVKNTLEQHGHSRVPVHDGSTDRIIGVLYARDLLKSLGEPADKIDVRAAIRPPFFVPESRKLRDLLDEFRMRKVHMAIVLDEYGGTAGLITIEDVLEEIVGDISDEHEPAGPAMLRQTGDRAWDVDARIYLDEFNRRTGLALPEDAGFDTLGGYISNAIGHIPLVGESLRTPTANYIVTDAEPQKINRVRVEGASNAVPTDLVPSPGTPRVPGTPGESERLG